MSPRILIVDVLIDMKLPGGDPSQVLRLLRQYTKTPGQS